MFVSSSKLTTAEKTRLEELNALVGELPFGETSQERNERDAIKKALDDAKKALSDTQEQARKAGVPARVRE